MATLAILVTFVLSACAPAAAPAPTQAEAESASTADTATSEGEKQIIYALYQEPELLNPYIATQTAAGEALTFIIEGLLNVDPDGNRFPVLAKEVPSVDNGLVSEDGMMVTYNLKEGILWSDGEPFTCDDVLFTYEAVTNPESGAVSTTGYDQIASVECPDELTVVVTFNEFYAPFLSLFGSIMPRHATGDPADMVNWDYNRMPTGTGPFKLVGWDSGDQIRLEANENYRDYPEKPLVDRVIIRIIESREVGKALITSGEIDILWDLTEADTPDFADNPSVIANITPGAGTERLLINLADPTLDATDDPLNHPHPILGDLRVRQAIQFGIDKQLLVDELLFGATTVGVSELSIGWAKCDIAESVYDPEQAKALLDEAGFTDEDGDGVRECHDCQYAEEGTPLRLKYQTTTGNQLREESQQLVIEMMKEIGVEFYIENVPSDELFGSWANNAFRKHGNFDILMYTTSDGIDPQSQMFGYFHSSQIPLESNGGTGFNYSRWINATADAALEAAGATPDEAERVAQYQIACEQIDAELPHIYLYDRSEVHLSRSNILNFKVNTWNNQTWNAEEWDKE
ncbi:MAG: peptide ABC transporter substrate-binding protein [Caldilineaceae bacterium]